MSERPCGGQWGVAGTPACRGKTKTPRGQHLAPGRAAPGTDWSTNTGLLSLLPPHAQGSDPQLRGPSLRGPGPMVGGSCSSNFRLEECPAARGQVSLLGWTCKALLDRWGAKGPLGREGLGRAPSLWRKYS